MLPFTGVDAVGVGAVGVTDGRTTLRGGTVEGGGILAASLPCVVKSKRPALLAGSGGSGEGVRCRPFA